MKPIRILVHNLVFEVTNNAVKPLALAMGI